jgi:hypothetical protein
MVIVPTAIIALNTPLISAATRIVKTDVLSRSPLKRWKADPVARADRPTTRPASKR